MKIKNALLQVADTGPLESLAYMLDCAGIRCYTPTPKLRQFLTAIGCDTVLSNEQLVSSMGYQKAKLATETAKVDVLNDSSFLYFDIKAHRNGPILWKHFPNLKDRTIWYRINGGEPEDIEGLGDEISPPCRVLTPNQWYRSNLHNTSKPPKKLCCNYKRMFYSFWPYFYRKDEYKNWARPKAIVKSKYSVCLVHNASGWGYHSLLGRVKDLGVRVYGRGSPDGLIPNTQVPTLLRGALALVHLKSNDAPGYAIYEAIYSRCPIICSKRFIWRSKMNELLIPGETCLTFDKETHDPLTEEDVETCIKEIYDNLNQLRDLKFNRQIAESAVNKLESLAWNAERDLDDLTQFLYNT